MITIGLTAFIYRPLSQVFDFMINPENDFQWQYGTLASAAMPGSEHVPGSMFRSISHLMGQRMECVYEVTEYQPNHCYGFRSLSGPVDSRTLYTFDISQSSTQIKISSEIDQRGLFKASDAMVEKVYKRQIKENLAMLKSILESHKPLKA